MAFNPYGQQHAVYLNNYQIFDDGGSHPLSTVYGSIGAARTVYPFATALTNEINWASVQAAIYDAGSVGGATLYFPYTLSKLVMNNANSALDGSGTLRLGDYSDGFNTGAFGAVDIVGEGYNTILAWPYDMGQPADASFTATIAANGQMTTSSVTGNIIPGMYVHGSGILVDGSGQSRQWIIYQISGTANGAGVYQLSNHQTAVSSPGSFSATFATTCNPFSRRAAIICGNYNDQFSAWYGRLRGFGCTGPSVGFVYGASSCDMMGLCTGDRTELDEMFFGDYTGAGFGSGLYGFYAGIYMQGGQTSWRNVRCNNNYYGVWFANQSQEFGNMSMLHCDFSSNARAGIACSPVYGMESTQMLGGSLDTQPYAFYKEPWTQDLINRIGFGPDSFRNDYITLDCLLEGVQVENIGNAAFGDGITPATLTGSIASTTLTVTAGTAQVGQWLQQASGGPAIAANTFITEDLGGGTWRVSVSQTVASGQIEATKYAIIRTTKMDPIQTGWGSAKIAAEQAASLFDVYTISGMIRPMTTFQMTPGTNSIFGAESLAAAVGIVSAQPGLEIYGDIGQLITNCIGAPRGGNQFFGTGSFITPGFVKLRHLSYWTATAAPTFDSGYPGTPVCGLGKVVLRHIAAAGTPVVCTGSPTTDDVMGVVIYSATWALIATSGEVPVSSGANVISAGQYVRTSSSGDIIAASGKSDTTSVVIGIAIANSGGGFTSVRLMGLE